MMRYYHQPVHIFFDFFNCNCIIGILPIPKFTLAKNKLGNNIADNFFKHLIGKTVM